MPEYPSTLGLLDPKAPYAPKVAVDVSTLATAGLGTKASPWTGWEAAANAAIPATGGTLYFRQGYFMISATWTPPAKVQIVGESRIATDDFVSDYPTVIQLNSTFTWTSARGIDMSGVTEASVRGIVIEPSGATITDPGAANGGALSVANTIDLDHIMVRNFHTAGAHACYGISMIGGGNWVTGRNVYVVGNDAGLRIATAGVTHWSQCYFGNSGSTGNLVINATQGSGDYQCQFTDCLIDEAFADNSCQIGASCQDVSFKGCRFYSAAGGGLSPFQNDGLRTKLTNCLLGPWNNSVPSATFIATANSTATLVNCNVLSNSAKPHINAGTGSSTTCAYCTFGAGTGVTGAGAVLIVDNDGSGNLRVRHDPTSSTVVTTLKPVAVASVGAAATDAGTTLTLANNLRTALINLGLVTT